MPSEMNPEVNDYIAGAGASFRARIIEFRALVCVQSHTKYIEFLKCLYFANELRFISTDHIYTGNTIQTGIEVNYIL